MAQYSSMSNLSAMAKERYADKLIDAHADHTDFVDRVPFGKPSVQIGATFHQPVILTDEQGGTHATAGASAPVALQTAVSFSTQDAQVTGAQVIFEGRVDYESAFRIQGDGRAFADVMDPKVKRLFNSAQRRVELQHLRGGLGLARIGNRITDSGTTQVFSIDTRYWSAGTMAGLENAVVDVVDGSTGSPGSVVTTTGATLTKVDIANKRITLVGVEAELDAITSAATDGQEDFLFFRGQKGADWTGLHTCISNTGSLFNIDAADYSLWQGNTVDAGSAALNMQTVFKAVDGPVARGAGKNVVLYVNPRTWSNLMGDLAAARRFDGSYTKKKAVNGFSAIEFESQNGTIEIVSHPLMWEGFAYMFDPMSCQRLGSTDISFTVPGDDRDIFFHVDGYAGYGFRLYTMQGLLYTAPASGCLISGIVNT